MPFTSFAVRKYSPFSGRPPSSSGIDCERSPFATAPITRPTSTVGCDRSSTSELIASMRSAQLPTASPICKRSPIRPSSPTCRRNRCRLELNRSMRVDMPFNRSATLPSSPVQSDGSRTEKSPSCNASSVTRSCFMNASCSRTRSREPLSGADFFLAEALREGEAMRAMGMGKGAIFTALSEASFEA